MIFDVSGAPVFAATGGRPFDSAAPVAVLIHGAGMNRTVWRYQARYLAHHGCAVLAVDLPGHGRSGGSLIADVPSMATWLVDALDAAGVEAPAALVGHSMGSFVALEAASLHPTRVSSLALLGTADAMPVHPELLAAADAGDHRAFDLITSWMLSRAAQLGGHPEPGSWMTGGLLAILEEGEPDVLANDLHAVRNYAAAPKAASHLRCPALVVIGRHDRMTPPKSARRLAANLVDADIVELETGHSMMTEDPVGVARALAEFLAQ